MENEKLDPKDYILREGLIGSIGVEVLAELLIKKNIITKEEFDSLFEEVKDFKQSRYKEVYNKNDK